MALVNTKEMLRKAYDGNYAIGAFNVMNLETIQAVARGANAQNSAVIMQVSSSALKYAGNFYLKAMIDAAVEETGIDIALHLDHGPNFETIKKAAEAGFTSVMFDGSHYPYENNVEKTIEIVEYAHARGITVEAKLGKLAGADEKSYTDPAQAADFVMRTKVDSLAVAIGTSHGAYKYNGEAKLDFARLEAITKNLEKAGLPNLPIVLHGASSVIDGFVEVINEYGGKIKGASGIPGDMLRKASAMSVCKVNIDTDIRLAMTAATRRYLGKKPSAFDPSGYMGDARKLIQDLVEDRIKNALGSANSL